MVTSDEDDRVLAILEFKKLNVAHSIDFVSNEGALKEYLNSKRNCENELPDVLLINSNIQTDTGIDPLVIIKSNSKWKKLEVIVFSTATLRKIIMNQDNDLPVRRMTDPDELIWMLREICGSLAIRVGWQYQIRSLKRNSEVYSNQ